MKVNAAAKSVVWCVLGAMSGLLLLLLPAIARTNHVEMSPSLVRLTVEGLSWMHLLLLFLGGLVWGVVLRLRYAVFASCSMVGSLPVLAVVDMCRDPTSHNLWPLEFVIYGVLSAVPVMGMLGGWSIAWLARKVTGRERTP
jgi:hypothetical protein